MRGYHKGMTIYYCFYLLLFIVNYRCLDIDQSYIDCFFPLQVAADVESNAVVFCQSSVSDRDVEVADVYEELVVIIGYDEAKSP